MAGQERVGILIELEDPDNALKTLQRIDESVRSLGRKRTQIKLDDGNLVSIDERIKEIQDKLAAVRSSKGGKILDHGEVKTAKDLNNELRILQRGLKDGTANAKTFAQTFNSISSKIAHAGSAMQSLGNALTRLTSPFRRLTTGFVMGAGYKALNLFTEGISNAFGRADTMRNYERSLGALGLDVAKKFKLMGDEALSAKDNLDLAVQGLPTSLDEIMAAQKVYAGATGEMVSSTKTAIAANNAFLASTTDSRQQRVLQRYFVALASGANLTATQWSAMRRNMPLAFRKIGEAMGYTTKNELAEFEQKLGESDEMAQKFLKTFQELGTTGVIRDAALVAVKSWSGLSSNIKIAFTRLGEGVIKTVNEVFEKATGRDLLSHLLGIDANGKEVGGGIKHWINDLSQSIQDWIRANPDELINFFNDLKAIDWKGLIRGMAEGMKWTADIIKSIAKIASDKDLSKLGRWAVKGNVFGWMFSTFGGLLKGLRHPLGFFGALATKGIGKTGIFGKIASLFGKKGDITAAETTAKTIPTVANTFKGAFSALQGLIQAAGAVLIVSGTGFVAFKAAKSILKDLKEMTDLVNGGGWDNVGYVASGVIVAIGAFTEIFNAIGTALGPQGLLSVAIASAASFLVTGSFAADMWAIKQGVIQIKDTITELDNVASAIENMKGIGTLGDNVKEKFRTTIDAINQIKEMFVGKNGAPIFGGEVQAGLPTFGIGKVNALTNIASAIEQMQSIVTQFNKLAVMTVSDPSAVLEQIKKACNELQGIRGPKNLVKHTEAVVDALKQIKTMAKRFNSLAGIAINNEGFAGFVQQIKDALDELKGLDQVMELDIKVVLGDGFRTSVNGVVKQIKDAKKEIEKLKTPIRYNIPVNVTFSVATNLYSALNKIREHKQAIKDAQSGLQNVRLNSAMGGAVYRARGGSIFRPRGTDTVPAMLTPGEFVHNRKAVNTFGIDFMRKVNNLDVRGAMNELMHRAGHMANVNRGSVVNNNYYNNNQRVTINNNGNTGAGFTFKSASRFVGAF